MDSVPCLGCSDFFKPRNKLQNYCSKSKCQKIRKALSQKEKMANDSEYRTNQNLSNQKWRSNNPDYWKIYRAKNPSKTLRNRMLQHVRNRRRNGEIETTHQTIIAKMDSRKPSDFKLEGSFWLVPTVAKMDARKFYFHLIPDRYK
jgi:hypothetical protein